MTILSHAGILRTKTQKWQAHFPWHIAFWGAWADRMPRKPPIRAEYDNYDNRGADPSYDNIQGPPKAPSCKHLKH